MVFLCRFGKISVIMTCREMKNRKAVIFSIAGIAIIVAIAMIFFATRKTSGVNAGKDNSTGLAANKFVEDAIANTRKSDDSSASESTKKFPPLTQAIADAELAIAQGGDARAILAALREQLLAAGNSAAAKAIIEYLESGRDCDTGLAFKVGKNGAMISTPTMRTFLLDLLASVDQQAALDYAETVFDAKASADEYAICLRNVGRIDTSDSAKSYIYKRASELLSDATLAANPTTGFVEAFDALAYAGDASAISILAQYLEEGKGTALNMPAFMALDRLAIDDTEATLNTLLENSSLLDDRPLTRAGYFARADLADEDQTEEVETYVLKLDAESDEAEYFFSTLPNLNFMIIDGILTDRLSISGDYVTERQSAAFEALETWESDSRFSAYKSLIKKAAERLERTMGK
jgi:hypothetical protein